MVKTVRELVERNLDVDVERSEPQGVQSMFLECYPNPKHKVPAALLEPHDGTSVLNVDFHRPEW